MHAILVPFDGGTVSLVFEHGALVGWREVIARQAPRNAELGRAAEQLQRGRPALIVRVIHSERDPPRRTVGVVIVDCRRVALAGRETVGDDLPDDVFWLTVPLELSLA